MSSHLNYEFRSSPAKNLKNQPLPAAPAVCGKTLEAAALRE
jgi:hypothetical protein